jgi:hypothetical protein
MRRFVILSLAVLLGSLVAGPAGARAQPAPSPADPLVPPRSLGKPLVWKPFVGGYFGLDRSLDENLSGGGALVGVYKDLTPSIVGIGASGEAYLGGYSGLSGVNGGVRALAELRSLLLPLRALRKPPDYAERVRALESEGWTATAMQVHNEIGFAQKDATVTSAVLYTLMPSGSLIVVPDSIWTHELWAAHLVGAALRGCHVYVVAPAAANAPSAGFPQMSRTREIFSRFLEIQNLLGPEIEARGGRLRTGLYTRRSGVDDVEAKLVEMHETFERYPFLEEDFPFPAEFYAGLADAEARLDAAGYTPDARLPGDARTRAPKLHRKTQLFATREALFAWVRDRRVQDVIAS